MNVEQDQLAKNRIRYPWVHVQEKTKKSAHKSDFKTKKSEEAQNEMRGPYIFQTVCVQMN